MENEARYTFVGSIVLLLSALLVVSLVWLMGGTDKTEYRSYSVYFHKQSMDGLEIKSAVKLRGVKVGGVTDYSFVKGSKGAVRVNIKVDQNTPIHEDTTALISRNLITGIATVELVNGEGDSGSKLLTKVTEGERYPLIQEGSSGLDKVTTDATKVVESSSEMLDKINLLLNEQNRESIAAILQNTAQFSEQLVQQHAGFMNTLKSFERAALQINQTAATLNQTTLRLEGEFNQLSDTGQKALQQVGESFTGIHQQSAVLSQEVQVLSRTVQSELKQMAQDVHDVSDSLTSTSQRYANPRALLLNSSTPPVAPGE